MSADDMRCVSRDTGKVGKVCGFSRDRHDDVVRGHAFVGADNPKAAPSLANELTKAHDDGNDEVFVGLLWDNWYDILAVLRAVEAVRAFKERYSYKSAVVCGCNLCDGFCDGVEAVQALLEGER